ncbi:FAD-binding oxidoreductase [Mesorhizobium sp. M1312]|uniref:NAD(P)/FAD-dependent oxidoreductase n=1 Tax=unclassified Mesorhizobium TaxID=325217 RepID=UPI00333AD868
MTSYDVAIIGGGIVGSSAALHLALRGSRVLLLERGRIGSQASGVNYGGVRRQGRHVAELPIAVRSRKIWERLPELLGTDCEFAVSGHLKLAVTEAQMAELQVYARDTIEFGLDLELIGKQEIRRRYPYLGENVVGGSFCPGDGHANPRLVAPAFARAAAKAGAEAVEAAEVVQLAADGKSFDLRLADGRSFRAARLINAAGAWGSKIAETFGESIPEDVMAPNMAVTEPLPYFIVPNIGVCGGGIYLRQIPRGNVIFGAGEGRADRDTIRARPLPEVTAEAARLALALVPRLSSAHIIRTWSGIEGRMPDGIPVIGPSTSTPGLYHAFGFCGHGFQLGPAVGAILADLALDGETTTPIDPFSVARFVKAENSLNTAVRFQAESGGRRGLHGSRGAAEHLPRSTPGSVKAAYLDSFLRHLHITYRG